MCSVVTIVNNTVLYIIVTKTVDLNSHCKTKNWHYVW